MADPMENFEEEDVDYVDNGEIVEEIILDDDLEDEDPDQYEMDEDIEDQIEDEVDGESSDVAEVVPNDSTMGFFGHTGSVYCVDIHPAGDLAVTGGGDDKAYAWSTTTGDKYMEMTGHKDSVSAVGFSTDGKFIATGGMDGVVMIWDVSSASSTPLATMDGPSEVTWLKWHPKGNILIAGSEDGTVWMWMSNGKLMNVFSGHTDRVECGGFTPDGKTIVTGSQDGSLIIWDPKTAQVVHRISHATDGRFHEMGITAIGFNPDSTIVVTGSEDNKAIVTHIHTGKIISILDTHTEPIECISFSTVQPLAATGSLDGKICIWDTANMRLRHTLSHDDAVIRLFWHPTEPYLVSASVDKTVRLWDGRTGQQLRVWRGHTDTLMDLAISKDGSFIVTGADDHCAFVFRI